VRLCQQFLPARAALLADYWQKTVDRTVEKWRFAEVDHSSARNNFGGYSQLNKSWYSHYQRVRLCLPNLNNPTP
jgi:ribosomal protein L32E